MADYPPFVPPAGAGIDATAAHPRGAWTPAMVNLINDVVTYGGHTYRAKAPSGPAGSSAPVATGRSSASVANPTTVLPLVIPATAQVGDLILLSISQRYSGGAAIPTPGGYTPVASSIINPGGQGNSVAVFSKVAVLADIGATVNLTGNGGGSSGQCRTYTCGGVDTNVVVAPAATGIPPAVTTAQASELLVVTYGVTTTTFGGYVNTLTAGGANPLLEYAAGYPSIAGLDFTAPLAGVNTPAGGVLSSNGATPEMVVIAVALLPAVGAFPAGSFDQWS